MKRFRHIVPALTLCTAALSVLLSLSSAARDRFPAGSLSEDGSHPGGISRLEGGSRGEVGSMSDGVSQIGDGGNGGAQAVGYGAVVSGVVRDAESGQKLQSVAVYIVGTPVGTVTNADGYFSLKIPQGTVSPVIEFSHLGYLNARYTPSGAVGRKPVSISLTPSTQELDQSVAYGSPRRIVEEALRRIPDNYPDTETLLNAFYRETVQKGRRYISISEAVMDVYKTAYPRRSSYHDLVRIAKARRLLSQKSSDTLSVKVMDGPNLALNLDVVKNADALLDLPTLDYYVFLQDSPAWIDNRIQYVVNFYPRVDLSYALFCGRLYIDCERLSITRAEFSLDLSDPDKAVESILMKKPSGLQFEPQEVSFIVNYRYRDGRSWLSYMCNVLRFKCDWRKRLFSSAYTARCEMVVVDGGEAEEGIAQKDAFKRGGIFYDMVQEYWSEDFWKDYNIIEPTVSLENAVRRLKK